MKKLFLLGYVSALLAGCATPPPDAVYSGNAQDANAIPTYQTIRPPRASVGIGLGSWGGRGFGGIGFGLGF
ncbi:MAG: hypothetical protein JWR68_3022 [Polaromonas sp.]|nr:hypothetical protein [Polaromonas sp.]